MFKRNFGKEGLIQILNTSTLRLDKCIFDSNVQTGYKFLEEMGGIIQVKHSNVSLNDTTFENNVGTTGASLHMVYRPDNFLQINNTIFFINRIILNGSSIYMENASDIVIATSQLLNDGIFILDGHLVKLIQTNFVKISRMPQLSFSEGKYAFSTEQ